MIPGEGLLRDAAVGIEPGDETREAWRLQCGMRVPLLFSNPRFSLLRVFACVTKFI